MEQSASEYLIIGGRPCDGIIIQFLAMNTFAKDSRKNNFIMNAKMACQINYNEQNAFDPKNKRIRTTSYEDGERLIASRVHRSIDTMVRDTTADEITSFKDGAIKENNALVNITIGITTTADAPHHMSRSRRGIMTKNDMHGRMGKDIRTDDTLKSLPQAAPTLRTLPSQPEISISMEEMTGMNKLDNGDISNPLSPPWYTCAEQMSTWIPAAVKTSTSMVAAATTAAIFKEVEPCWKGEQLTVATSVKPLSRKRPSSLMTWATGTTFFDRLCQRSTL